MNEKELKKIALELLSHSKRFESKSLRTLNHAIEALSLLSDLEQVAKKSLKEAFHAAQIAMEKTLEKKTTVQAIPVNAAAQVKADPKTYTQWIDKIKPEYRDAFKNPALFQAFLKIQMKATTQPVSAQRERTQRTARNAAQHTAKSSDFSLTAPPQMGATVEKPGSAMRRKPLGAHPVLRPKRSS